MRINTSWDRWLHLAVLCFFTGLGATALVHYLDWKPLSALSLSCVATVQINNAIQMLTEGGIPTTEDSTGAAVVESVAKKQD